MIKQGSQKAELLAPSLYQHELRVEPLALGLRGLLKRKRLAGPGAGMRMGTGAGAGAGSGSAASAPEPEDDSARAPRHRSCNNKVYAVWNYFWLFMEISSIHGFNHLTTRHRSLWEYIFWIVIMVLCFAGCVAIAKSTWTRYSENPTVLSMDRDRYSFKIQGPSITLCAFKAYNEKLFNATLQKQGNTPMFNTFLRTIFNATYKNFANLNDISESFGDFIKPVNYQDIIYQYRVINKLKFVSSYDDVIKKEGLPKPAQTQVLTEMGFCDTYNNEIAFYLDPAVWAGNSTPPTQNTLIYAFESSGMLLSKVMNIKQFSKGYIHSAEEMPDAGSRYSVMMETEKYLEYNVEALAITTSKEARSLSVKQRRCRFLHESHLEISPIYSYTFCRMQCRMRLALSICHCVPHFYRNNGRYKVCSVRGMKCLAKHSEELIKLRDMHNHRIECDCLPLCDRTNFKIWLAGSMRWHLGMQVQYDMKQFPTMKISRDVLFGFTDVLVNIGGTAGLFLGFSILSLVETVYFVTLRLFWHIVKLRRQSKLM
ncbi:hypothetical protein R5R35_007230 [Gryllus longicercus]|uniref:Sodium channel protein Nach n=1 Tax=Gryllus longicercus TaxID=2509291 RepID=A0AAN9VL41_9ORTH